MTNPEGPGDRVWGRSRHLTYALLGEGFRRDPQALTGSRILAGVKVPMQSVAPRRLVAVCLTAAVALSPMLQAASLQVPPPPDGAWVAASVALLRYNRERCDRLATRILAYWRTLPSEAGKASSSNQKSVRERIVKDWLAELTEARTAADVARSFLPKAAETLDNEGAGALVSLLDLQGKLCDQVAYPTGPLAAFVDRVTDSLLRIDTQERALAETVSLDEKTLSIALEPYLEPLQLAGVEAEGEMLSYLERPPQAAQKPAFEALLARWYQHYREASGASKRSLGQYLDARKTGDRTVMRESCEELVNGTIDILADDNAFASPHTRVGRPLRLAFVDLKRMAAACLQGDFRRADRMLSKAQYQLAAAAAYLKPYGLSP